MMELKTVALREDGCFSVSLWDTRPFAVALERTFENLRTVLTAGQFWCERDFYHKGGYETFQILVPNHDRVLFHKLNIETESEACVGLAESFGQLDGRTAILDSKHGFEEFMALTAGLNRFLLDVTGRP